jgi:glycosyltransferase involved in cell wall biosynthesis
MAEGIGILYVSPFSHIGGGEMSILTVMRNLDRKAFRPVLVTYAEGPFAGRARACGIETHVLRRSGLLSEPAVIGGLVGIIKSRGVRLVHVNSLDLRGAAASRIAAVPLVGHLRVIIRFTRRDRLFVRMSSMTIAVSAAAVEAFCRNEEGLRKKFVVMPNMVEAPGRPKGPGLRAECAIGPDCPLIGAIGRIDPYKGFEVLIDAAPGILKSAPDARFLVVGGVTEGDERGRRYLEELKRRAAGLGLGERFIFAGFRDDIPETMASLDAVVVPSYGLREGHCGDTEGFGRVAVEAMAAGVPVVSSNAGGLKEIVEDGTSGILVEPGDAAATAEAVVRILKDTQFADRLRLGGRKRFEEMYSVKRVKELEAVYRRLIALD